MKTLLRLFTVVSILTLAIACREETAPPASSESAGEEPAKPEAKAALPEDDTAFVGMKLGDAEKLAEERGLKHRVVERDGKPLPATKDYRPDRINFSVEKDVVVKTSRG